MFYFTCVYGCFVLGEVFWQRETKEEGEADDEEVPGGVQINKLQVRNSNSGDHSWNTWNHSK